jgi:glutaredoxin
MKSTCVLAVLALAILSGVVSAINLTIYYGEGCPHCVSTLGLLFNMSKGYNLSIEGREVYHSPQNLQEMQGVYWDFGIDPGRGGVPTVLVENRSLVVGEVSRERWQEIFGYCAGGGCKEGVFTQDSFSQKGALQPAQIALMAAALVVLAITVYVFAFKRKPPAG